MNSYEIKAGFKSSEWWIALGVLAFFNVFAAVSPSIAKGFPANPMVQTLLPIISIGLAALVNVLVSVGWIAARTSLKKSVAEGGKNSESGNAHILGVAILAVALLAILTGCTVQERWVMASDATYQAIGPAHAKYINADQSLSDVEKKAALLTLGTWKARIEEWKRTLDMKDEKDKKGGDK